MVRMAVLEDICSVSRRLDSQAEQERLRKKQEKQEELRRRREEREERARKKQEEQEERRRLIEERRALKEGMPLRSAPGATLTMVQQHVKFGRRRQRTTPKRCAGN